MSTVDRVRRCGRASRRASAGAPGLCAVACAALIAAAAGWVAHAAEGPTPDRLVFLLEYVGSDYENAVRDGRVVDRLEYGEVLRFARELAQGYEALPRRSEAVSAGLRELERLLADRAPEAEVWATTRRLLPLLSESTGGVALPAAPPDLASGRRLWTSDCAICHGVTGSGDGRAAAGMEPPPTAFRGRALERLSPRKVYHALTFGIAGTAMPSFDAYTPSQRWDVAFYAMTLRVGFAPKRPPVAIVRTPAELAVRSNEELLAELRQERADASAEEVDYLRADVSFAPATALATAAATAPAVAAASRGTPGTGGASPAAPGAGPAGAPAAVAAAVQVQDAFAAVAARVSPRVVGVSGWERDAAWTPELLQRDRGDVWISANADEIRYPGFRRTRSASGFLLGDDGTVVTADHLVRDDAGAILPLVDVELANDVHVPADVLGAEPTLDLAVLRLAPGSDLAALGPSLDLGDGERLQVGHWVVALGDPPGPEKVFAVGVVSAPPSRHCYQEHLSATLLQSSLAVPPPGLGGPVTDVLGRVVGVSVRPRALAAGFAAAGASGTLPIDLALNLTEALTLARSVSSPWLGVSVLELPLARRALQRQGKAARFPEAGLYIDAVFDPSPAARAGIRPGDFLVALGGHPTPSVGEFQRRLYGSGIGARVDLDLLRDGVPLRVAAPIEERPEAATQR